MKLYGSGAVGGRRTDKDRGQGLGRQHSMDRIKRWPVGGAEVSHIQSQSRYTKTFKEKYQK